MQFHMIKVNVNRQSFFLITYLNYKYLQISNWPQFEIKVVLKSPDNPIIPPSPPYLPSKLAILSNGLPLACEIYDENSSWEIKKITRCLPPPSSHLPVRTNLGIQVKEIF